MKTPAPVSPDDPLAWLDSENCRNAVGNDYVFARAAVSDFITKHYDEIAGDRDDLAFSARSIGIPVQEATFIFENETEMALLQDYHLMIEATDGETRMSSFLASFPRNGLVFKDEVAIACLESFRYTVFYTEESVPGFGLKCFDLLARKSFFLTDRNFPKSFDAASSAMIASGIMCHGEAWMTSGAAVPYPLTQDGMLAEIEDMVVKDFLTPLKWKERPPMDSTRPQQDQLARNLIRLAVKNGHTDRIRMA